jgi:hypothetical protein
MKILVLHRVPYPRIEYARGIDHDAHEVTYFGTAALLATLPRGLHHEAIERPGEAGTFDEAFAWLSRKPRTFERVIALSEYDLLDAARLREWLAVGGPTTAEVILVHDKVAMKSVVREAGLRVPRFTGLADFLGSPHAANWQGRTVLKPLSGASSEDVMIFDALDDVTRALATRTSGVTRLDGHVQSVDAYEIEEFVSGDILHFDGLVANGEVVTLMASRYIGTCLGYAKGQPLGSYHFPMSDGAQAWVAAALKAVGIRQGSFHLEAIESGDELVFLEVGNRVGGADVVATFEHATGVHLPSEELRLLLGEPSRALPATQIGDRWHGWFVFPGHTVDDDGYRGLGEIDAFRGHPALVRWAELGAGAPLPRKVTYSAHEAPLAGIVANRTWQGTRDWIRALFSAVSASPSVLRIPVPPAFAVPRRDAVPAAGI